MLKITVFDRKSKLTVQGVFRSVGQACEFYAEVFDDYPQFIHIVATEPAPEATAREKALTKEYAEIENALDRFMELVVEYDILAEFPKEAKSRIDGYKKRLAQIEQELQTIK